jgi:hypothetical protein
MLKPLLKIFCGALIVSSCALPQRAERYHYSADAITATRYAGREVDPIDEITINLKSAVQFEFRFPDGYWVISREITRQTLIDHGIINDKNAGDDYVAWHPTIPIMGAIVGRHQYFSFGLGKDGNPYELRLGACGYSFDQVLRKFAGGRTYGFPLSVQEAEELFGKPTSVESFSIVTGFTCL